MIRGVTALLCALFLSSMLVVSLDNGQQQISPQIKIETGKNMGHQNGGYHIATNEWWTPSRPFQVSQNDSDGDGVVNSIDTHPLNPSLPPPLEKMGTTCLVRDEKCSSDPNPAPFDSAPYQISIGTHALDVAWGDVDGDGDLDIAVANNGAPNAVFLNDGMRISTTKSWQSQDSNATMSIAWVDFDLDGDLDLSTSDYEGSVILYRNQNNELEDEPYWDYTYNDNQYDSKITSFDWGDIDNDGYPDLAIGISGEGLEVFFNNLGVMPSNSDWIRTQGRSTTDVALSDIDGDGDLDLIEAASSEKNHIYRYTGTTFTPNPIWQSQSLQPSSSIAVGDIDGDGDNDIVFGTRGQSSELYINSQSGFNTLPTWTSIGLNQTTDVALSDVDGDGDLDLFESNSNEKDRIYIFQGNEFDREPIWISPDTRDTASTAWGDVDGDGDQDLISADSELGPLLFVRGGYRLRSNTHWNDGVAEYTYSLGIGDMDDDGDQDIAVGNGMGVSRVYENQNMNFVEIWNSTIAHNAEDMLFFDVDDDGIKELMLGDYNGKNKAWRGSPPVGGGGYTLATTCCLWQTSTSTSTMDLLVGDINGDGMDDIVDINDGQNIAHYMIPTGGGNWFLNQQESWTSSSYEFSVCGKLADFDNDGLLDLFVANFYGQSELYINSVQGMPTSATWTSAQSYDSMDCDVGDIDGDGYVDAIISTESDSNFLFHNNNGILSSNPVWSTPEKDDTMGIGLWDVDADGDLDWVEANYNHSKNRIRLNSNGTFSTIIWESPDSMDSWYVEMADLEGDGDLDMVIANEQQVNQIYLSDPDQDGDWVSELSGDGAPFDPTQIADSDGDGFGDRNEGWRPDDCPYSWGDSWRERWGCPDLDGDGQSDLFDPFMQNNTQWTDIDGDGLGDNWGDTKLNSTRNSRGLGEWIEGAYLPDPSPWDYDNDGYEDEGLDGANYSIIDDCSYHVGISFLDRKGCPDYDGDGWSNPSSDWLVSQGADAFPGDPSQWNDSDNDGFGDSSRGNQPDNCVNIAGTSTEDVFGCPDADGDGWSDDGDFDSENPAVWSDDDDDGFDDQLSDGCLNDKGSSTEDRGGCKDYDRDGYSDPDSDSLSHPNGDADAFPFEETQWRNQDGDDYGDNISGNNPDYCYDEFGTSLFRIIEGEIVDWFGCTDQDNDGLYDGDDHCPLVGGTSSIDRFGCPDSDDDGMSDLNDDCELQPGDSTIEFIGCPDTDGDGIPDSIDPEPRDGSGSADDWDADGIINSEDAFPNDSTQWIDGDEDGLGDNPNGTNPDPLPGDKDNDGWPDSNDSFINNPSEWLDTDGDGIGDNTDTDDDGDGYSDILEEQVGTDPKDANSHTVESWELIIPGTRIGLSWWDLLGIMAGLPLASWLGYGLVTRNKRVAEFEEELGKATTKIGIEEVAIRAEHALMLRLIGPHQAIRLERLRAELDDALGVEGFPITSEQTEIVLDDMEQIHEEAYVPEIPDTSIDYQITESDGYEWKNEDGQFHYRVKGGDGVWLPWGE